MFVTASLHLKKEEELTAEEHSELRSLLSAVLPQQAQIFSTQSYYISKPQYHVIARNITGELISHLHIEVRHVIVGKMHFQIGRIGDLATLPPLQGRGFCSFLLNSLPNILTTQIPVDFGYINCRDHREPLFAKRGWHSSRQRAYYIHSRTRERTVYDGLKMILPAMRTFTEWPIDEEIDLLGPPW